MRAWILVAVMIVTGPRIARADDDNKKAAREEFAAGQDADRRKDYQVAIEHYLRAYDLSPHPNALYNAAVDYERVGDLRESARFYGQYLDESPDSDDHAKVARLIENLRKRPSMVQIRTTPPGGQITIDGAPAGQAPVSRELAGGTHVITAAIGDRKNQRQATLEFGEPIEVVLALAEQQGMLTVTSNVTGAQVQIDGANAGATPLTIAVPAGDRKVIVSGEGYSTLERTVKVPAEGSAQITATLVRPLGYTPVTSDGGTVARSWVFSAEGGRVLQAETTAIHIGFGYRIKGWEAAGRLAYFGQNTSIGYGLLIRRYLGDSKIKPYLGAIGEYGASKSSGTSVTIGIVGAHAGLMVEMLTTEKYAIELTVDGGAALFASDGERVLAFPVSASLQFRGR